MAQTITAGPFGDPPTVIGDKVRALPANQGKNNYDMWLLIDAEVLSATAAGTLIPNTLYTQPSATTSSNKHGNK